MSYPPPPPHVVLFPFMSKGHTIPLLHLARLLVRRNAAVVTIFTTPANHPFVSGSLSDVVNQVRIIDLPFPDNIPGVPPGVESTDQLSDISLWLPLAKATKLMQPCFEQALKGLVPPSVTFMVTDGFLWWTVDAAIRLGIPRLVYYGMGNFATTVHMCCVERGILKEVKNDDELVMVPNFPCVKVSRNDFDPVMWEGDVKDPHFEFYMDTQVSTSRSYGVLVNSFYELEPTFVDFSKLHLKMNIICVGPLCLEEPETTRPTEVHKRSFWMEWLDVKLEEGKSVLYVAFGSQAEISSEQLREIKDGLEKSGLNLLWVVRKKGSEVLKDGFEERVKGRGLVVKEWVNQREILGHQSVQGFLSHCGWGSVMESVCAKTPILAWPMMAEQPLNARFVVGEAKIGIMVETEDGSVRGFVKSEGLEKSVKELMEGETGKTVRKRAKEYGEAAVRAMEEGGSSWNELNNLLIKLLA